MRNFFRRWYRGLFKSKKCICGAWVDKDRPICNSFPAQCVDRDYVYNIVRLGIFKREYHWDELNHDPARYN